MELHALIHKEARLHSSSQKKRLPGTTDFSENTKGWTGGFPLERVTHNFLSRLQATLLGLERKRHASSKEAIFSNTNVLLEWFGHSASTNENNVMEKGR